MLLNIETTANETIIRLPKTVQFEYLQRIIDYVNTKEILSRSQASDVEIDQLAEQSQADWWQANKSRWIK